MMPPLQSASAAGASSAGASSAWVKYDSIGLSPPPHLQAHQQPEQRPVAYNHPAHIAATHQPPQLGSSLRQVGQSWHIVTQPVSSLPPQPVLRVVSHEQRAARATSARLATHAHVGPHVGPGSGAPLNFMISKMRGAMDRLERLDSDDSDDGGGRRW